MTHTYDSVRSIAFANDIVIGILSIHLFLRATGEPSLPEAEQIDAGRRALALMARLQRWQSRSLDGAGEGAISLGLDEKWWAYLAFLKCRHMLEFSQILEMLRRAWLEGNEVINERSLSATPNMKNLSRSGWLDLVDRLKEWLDESASALNPGP